MNPTVNNKSPLLVSYRNIVNLTIIILAVISSIAQSLPSKKADLKGSYPHGVRLQPELDKVDLEAYLANRKALALQVQCVVYDGPCDWVGRWVKPRVTSALLGECLLCTEYQKSHMERIMAHIEAQFPEEFKIGVKKYLKLAGIDVPEDNPQTVTTPANSSPDVNTTSTTLPPGNSTTTTTTAISPISLKSEEKSP